jgi:hypothetical protein
LLILPSHQIPGTLGRYQNHIEILARLDLLEVDVEAMGEQQRGAFLEQRFELGIQRLLREIGHQHGHQLSAFYRRSRFHHLQAVLLRLGPTVAFPHADHHVIAAVAQVQRMRAALTAIPQNGDARATQRFLIDVFLRIQTHANLLIETKSQKPKDPA